MLATWRAVAATTRSTDGHGDRGRVGRRGRERLAIAADASGALRFDKSALTPQAGEVTITMYNPSDSPGRGPHAMGRGRGGEADLKPGEYRSTAASTATARPAWKPAHAE